MEILIFGLMAHEALRKSESYRLAPMQKNWIDRIYVSERVLTFGE